MLRSGFIQAAFFCVPFLFVCSLLQAVGYDRAGSSLAIHAADVTDEMHGCSRVQLRARIPQARLAEESLKRCQIVLQCCGHA